MLQDGWAQDVTRHRQQPARRVRHEPRLQTEPRLWRRARFLPGLAVLLVSLAAVQVRPASAQGVTVALVPVPPSVVPGALFDLDLVVTQAGSPFNGFGAVIGYDPAALTLVPRVPLSLQEGSLMRGACGNTFHRFRQGADTDTITDVLLCNGVSLTGPGQIYHLQFRASTTPQFTEVRFLDGLQFYNAGILVNPVFPSDATITIGTPSGVGSVGPTRPELRIVPNPAPGAVVFTVVSDRAGRQRIDLFDVRGRMVRRFDEACGLAGARTVAWDGRDADGRPVPGGIYFVRLDANGVVLQQRVSLLRR
jgi:hypothetical protein